MHLRTILLLLAIISLGTVGTGGYFIASQLTDTAWDVAWNHTDKTAAMVRKQVEFYLAQHRRFSVALSGVSQLGTARIQKDDTALKSVNRALDHHCSSLKGAVCYLMDREGKTIASSNRNTPVSFVGKNYGFRPYFKNAMVGESAIYLALGVTSKKRGIYFSAPVMVPPQQVGGVVVVKYAVDELEKEFSTLAGTFALTDSSKFGFPRYLAIKGLGGA